MPASACLVTSTPTFQGPTPTAPLLLEDTATPDLREPVLVDIMSEYAQPFSASFVSEDPVDPATDLQEPVAFRLYFDYGQPLYFPPPELICKPFLVELDARDNVAGGTLADGPRSIEMNWVVEGPSSGFLPGCHTVTMMASHAFDDTSGCPVSLADSSQLTWIVNVCDSTSATHPCTPCTSASPMGCMDNLLSGCAAPTASCPAVIDGGMLPFCTGDGGAP
jgi:hypothetical protein